MKYNFDLVLEEENALTKIIRQIDTDSKVLEFGPANGRMTRYLKEKKNCSMYFVEIDEEAAEDAKKYAVDYMVGDIEEYQWLDRWENEKFDYITFADVLEHLRNPEEVLMKTKALLKEDGKVIISVPNVAHNSILINLHNNIFNYTPVGLLDNTHIHLFAYNTLVAVCNSVGYLITVEDAVYVPVGQNEVQSNYGQVSKNLKNELLKNPYGNVYQFVFTLQKKEFCIGNDYECKKLLKSYISDNHIKLYYDNGIGWSEDCCISKSVRNRNDLMNIEFVFDGIEEIKGLRLDPLDDNCIIQIKSIDVHYESGVQKVDIESLNCNAYIKLGNIFGFSTEDPQIYIPVKEEKPIKLSIEYSFLCFVRDVYEGDFISTLEKLFKDQEVEISDCKAHVMKLETNYNEVAGALNAANEELDRRMVELNNRMDVINRLNQENMDLSERYENAMIRISEIENTKGYKLVSKIKGDKW